MAAGVKTYVPELVLLIVLGFHVPEMPLGETFANVGGVVPEHKFSAVGKSGVMLEFTVMVTDLDRVQVTAGPTNEISSKAKSLPAKLVVLS